MTNGWIIDVLTDLKKFTASNHLSRLAEQLDDTIMVAGTELSLAGHSGQIVGRIDKTRGHAGPSHSGNGA